MVRRRWCFFGSFFGVAFALSEATELSWKNFVEDVVERTVSRLVPAPDRTWGVEPEQCRTSPPIRRLRVALHVAVTDWLTSAPSRRPTPGGEESFDVIGQAVALSTSGYLQGCDCHVAQLAVDLFNAVVQGHLLGPGFPGSDSFSGQLWPVVPHLQVILSDFPVFGLAAQAMRLQTIEQPYSLLKSSGVDSCNDFLLSIPTVPFDPDAVFMPSVHILEEFVVMDIGEDIHAGLCRLAVSIALAVLVQGTERIGAIRVAEGAAALLEPVAQRGWVGPPAARAALFFLLDRALACEGIVDVVSPGGVTFPLHVFPFREHMSDQMRLFKESHCSIQETAKVDLESELLAMLVDWPMPERFLIVEIGTAFGQCLLPLLLTDIRVEALAVEPSRRLRSLLGKSLSAARVLDRVKVSPIFVSQNSSLSDSLTMVHDIGHLTVGTSEGTRLQPKLRGGEALPLIREESSAAVLSLPHLLSNLQIRRLELLLVSVPELCAALSGAAVHAALGLRCARRLDPPWQVAGMCAFATCEAMW